MGYYRGGGRAMHLGRTYRVRFRGGRSGYWMAGGFGSWLKKAAKKVGGAAASVAKTYVKGVALLGSGGKTTDLAESFRIAAGQAAAVSGAGGAAGRIGTMFNPHAAPAGLPADGTPPLARTLHLATHSSPGVYNPAQMALAHGSARRKRRHRRRR